MTDTLALSATAAASTTPETAAVLLMSPMSLGTIASAATAAHVSVGRRPLLRFSARARNVRFERRLYRASISFLLRFARSRRRP
jgi:hypothetical protein